MASVLATQKVERSNPSSALTKPLVIRGFVVSGATVDDVAKVVGIDSDDETSHDSAEFPKALFAHQACRPSLQRVP
jgi:hypothetical protein